MNQLVSPSMFYITQDPACCPSSPAREWWEGAAHSTHASVDSNMYLHTQQPPRPRSPPRVVVHSRAPPLPEGASGGSPAAAKAAPTATTAVAAHLTSDVRRRLRMELHSQHLQHRHLHHAHYQQYHGSLSGRPLQEDRAVGDGSGGVSSHTISSSEGGTSSSAARRAAVAMLQDGLQRIDEEERGKKPHKITAAATAPLAAKRPTPPTAPNPSTLPLTIGMGMLRTTSAGSLPSLLRAGKRQLPSSSATTTTTIGGGGDDGAKEGNIRGGATAAGDVAEGHSHKKQGMANDNNRHGITLASSASASASSIAAAGSAATTALGAGSGMGIFTSSRRGRSCGDLGSSSAFSKSVPASLHLGLPNTPKTPMVTQQQPQQSTTTSLFGFALPFPNILTGPRPAACPSPVGRTCGAASIKGRKPGRPLWENQDSYLFVEPELTSEQGLVGMYAVMDGHGEAGHKVSCHCRERLPQLMAQVGYDPHRAYALMQEELKATFGQTVASSGCTCVMALLRRHREGGLHLTVANLGDSRCVLGCRRRVRSGRQHEALNVGSVGSNGSSSSSSSSSNGGSSDDEEGEGKEEEASIVAIALSDDHKPDRPSEHRRIVAAGGRVGCRQYYVSGHGRSASMPSMTVQLGPPRLWYSVRAQGELTGLAMSRSLGDVAAHLAGGCAEPEVLEHVVAPGDEFVVLATDGLWDVVGNQLAVELVDAVRAKASGGNWDPKEAARALLQFARQRWESLSPEMIDDISVLVVKLR